MHTRLLHASSPNETDLPRTLFAVGVVYALSGPGYWLWQRLRRQKDAAA